MRTSPILTALFPAVRQEILTATLLSPERSWYLSELAAHLKTSPSSLQRELEALAESGILQRRQEGRRTYYDRSRRQIRFLPLPANRGFAGRSGRGWRDRG